MADSTNAPKPSSSVKLVLLGEAAVGKSSLVLRFVNNDFQENKEPTIGAAFLTQKCNLPTRTIKFEIWDTAGQERFASLAPMYYRNAQAALVVYDLTKPTSLIKAKHWVAELQRQASPGIVIALVGNKLDLTGDSSGAADSEDGDEGESGDARKVSTEEAQSYAEEEGLLFFETSAKSGHNVTEVFTAIANAIPETSLKSARGAGASSTAARGDEEQRTGLGRMRLDDERTTEEVQTRCFRISISLPELPPDLFAPGRTRPRRHLFTTKIDPPASLPEHISSLPSSRTQPPHDAPSVVLGFAPAHEFACAKDREATRMASTITEAQAELIRSLAPDDIPIKLRCAICSKLAVNAYRLPCCEQAICESCQSNLPASCPVCEHSPLSAEDCNPNKSLRTTIRVFLRTAEKKREASRPKEGKDSEPATPVEPPKQSLQGSETPAIETPSEQAPVKGAPSGDAVSAHSEPNDVAPAQPADQESAHDDSNPAPQQPHQDDSGHTEAAPVEAGASDETRLDNTNEQALVPTEGDGDQDDDKNIGEQQENPETESMNGNFPNGSFAGSGDFNQMQMMMAMQNGMTPSSFGGFPMMGMPGMSMDPMTMQNMYMNGGFQGMGMNGMGGFGGGFGQGSNNNWNGSQSWNFDQNNYNQSGPGMGTGDFGSFNSGFQTGYNQGNYGHFNDYRRNNFGRGRGRGRGYYGGYGRGGYQFGGNTSYQDQGQFSQHGAALQGQNGTVQGESTEEQEVGEHGRAAQQGEGGSEGVEDAKPSNSSHQDASREAIGNEAAGDASVAPNMGSGVGNTVQRNGAVAGPKQ
ncbi:hypothetical protein NM208_g11673 [Fusarium decemcellulare]|uniref:Uncharacterized protein n=1 Tax=Fusarium decemcellulare TaxID=57161 RepID=A0ACC1RU13_9HYPO|nr:hypothetical protein NM208_g11673 [Fusarium decemcellulare]